MKSKQTISLAVTSMMAAGLLAGCGSSASSAAASTADSTAPAADSTSTAATSDAAGKVYYLNFKPEQDEAWQALAKTYPPSPFFPPPSSLPPFLFLFLFFFSPFSPSPPFSSFFLSLANKNPLSSSETIARNLFPPPLD